MASSLPMLWQIKVSHYNEKVRWALDYKRIPHRRIGPWPLFGSLPAAWLLTRRPTLPVLRLDGRAIGDSTAIVATLEERFPRPAALPDRPRPARTGAGAGGRLRRAARAVRAARRLV